MAQWRRQLTLVACPGLSGDLELGSSMVILAQNQASLQSYLSYVLQNRQDNCEVRTVLIVILFSLSLSSKVSGVFQNCDVQLTGSRSSTRIYLASI